VKRLTYRKNKLEEQVNLKNKKIRDLLINHKSKVNFNLIESNLELKNENYNLYMKKFHAADLLVGKNITRFPISTAYLEFYDDNLFIVSGDGIISYEKLEKFINNNEDISTNIIKSNILDVITDKSFLEHSFTGVKDIAIIDDKVYLSYSVKIEGNCRNTSILSAQLNYEYLTFEKFLTPSQCITDGGDFGIKGYWNTGGRIVNKDDNYIYFTHGTYGSELLAQDRNSIFGKVVQINKNTKEYELVSIGHRNAQGLSFSKNFLINTEHGPSGGDELNVNDISSKKIRNFGWPISSYGEHVGWGDDEELRKKFYRLAPLHKSHEKYGYVEPKKTCVPSCAISQVISVPNNFLNNNSDTVIYGTLGGPSDGGNSLHVIEFSKNYEKITKDSSLFLDRRVRDMIYVNKHNLIVLYLESLGELALIRVAQFK